ncbi:MAG: hypothetical protein SFV19_06520 [Rhodospirillaceae bacterium]|nr:hypothetical protein [Rhodospirillaceae bacterium]
MWAAPMTAGDRGFAFELPKPRRRSAALIIVRKPRTRSARGWGQPKPAPAFNTRRSLEMWQPRRDVPASLTAGALSHEIEMLSASLAPASDNEFTSAMARLVAVASTLGIACPGAEVLRMRYREILADLPVDLINRAIKRIADKWIYGNRVPTPAEIRAVVKPELTHRAGLLRRARFALLKLSAQPRPSEQAVADRRRDMRDVMRDAVKRRR